MAKEAQNKPATTRGRRRRRTRPSAILTIVQQAREAAKTALDTLRQEIRATQRCLERLVESEQSFRIDLFGGAGEPRAGSRRRGRAVAQRPRRKGPPMADRFFAKLPQRFGIDDVRKLAGRLSGVSVAQWRRAQKIKKVGKGYEKGGVAFSLAPPR